MAAVEETEDGGSIFEAEIMTALADAPEALAFEAATETADVVVMVEETLSPTESPTTAAPTTFKPTAVDESASSSVSAAGALPFVGLAVGLVGALALAACVRRARSKRYEEPEFGASSNIKVAEESGGALQRQSSWLGRHIDVKPARRGSFTNLFPTSPKRRRSSFEAVATSPKGRSSFKAVEQTSPTEVWSAQRIDVQPKHADEEDTFEMICDDLFDEIELGDEATDKALPLVRTNRAHSMNPLVRRSLTMGTPPLFDARRMHRTQTL